MKNPLTFLSAAPCTPSIPSWAFFTPSISFLALFFFAVEALTFPSTAPVPFFCAATLSFSAVFFAAAAASSLFFELFAFSSSLFLLESASPLRFVALLREFSASPAFFFYLP